MTPSSLHTREEIQDAYRGGEAAASYVERRFASELHRLLHDRQVGAVNRLLAAARPADVLEIAPGPGRLTREVKAPGRLVCLEFNEGMIREGLRACGGRAAWVRGTAFRLPFAEAFDVVYSFRFVRHFHRADREALYAEVRRVLRPGGYFLLDAVNERISRPLREAHPEEYPIYDELYTPDSLRAELGQSGLPPVELTPVQKWLRWQGRSQVLLGPRSSWLNRLVIRALERLPRRDGLEWVVLCRRA
jgi:SAM-dependent methyltransferase